jgi:hypothetical protein
VHAITYREIEQMAGATLPSFVNEPDARVASIHPTQLCQNCAKTLTIRNVGVSFEREADSPSCCKH